MLCVKQRHLLKGKKNAATQKGVAAQLTQLTTATKMQAQRMLCDVEGYIGVTTRHTKRRVVCVVFGLTV